MADGEGDRVLVVDDDPQLRRALDVNLRIRGYVVDLAHDGETALRLAVAHRPALVILDLGLPGIDGVEVIAGLRGWSQVPIMVLSARQDEHDKVAALNAGADDYVTKPFGMEEAMARVKALLRRRWGPGGQEPVVHTACASVDLTHHTIRVTAGPRAGGDAHLTPTEWTIVDVLARNADRLVTRHSLTMELWGSEAIDPSALRVHIANIRRKVERDPSRPCCLVTESGMGYRLVSREVEEVEAVERP